MFSFAAEIKTEKESFHFEEQRRGSIDPIKFPFQTKITFICISSKNVIGNCNKFQVFRTIDMYLLIINLMKNEKLLLS